MKSFYRLLAGIVSAVMLAGMIPASVLAEDTALYTFFHDKKADSGTWANTIGSAHISEAEDTAPAKEGNGSYRIKLYVPNGYESNATMLYVNLVKSPESYTPDTQSQYLTLWYQPLLKRERVEVGFACGSGSPFAMLRVNLLDYITIDDSEYGNDTIWKEVKIPMADFLDDKKAAFYDNGTGLTAFNWERFAGFSIAASDENLSTNQANFCRIDEVKIIDDGTGGGEPVEPPEEPQYPTGDVKWSFVDDDANGWIKTSGNEFVSVVKPLDHTAAKEGSASQRIKLSTPSGYASDGTMLYANIINSYNQYPANIKNAEYLALWYQPLLKRDKIEVGLVCGKDQSFAMLRVNLLDYVDIASSEYADSTSTPWKLVKIPMADFLDNNKAAFYANGTDFTEFDWSQFAGFSIAGSDEGLQNQLNFCRIDEVKIVGDGTGENPTTKPTVTPTVKPTETPTGGPTATPTVKPTATATAVPTREPIEPGKLPQAKGETDYLFFDDNKVGWSVSYVDSKNTGGYVSEAIDKTPVKEGTASYRLKLNTPDYKNTDTSNVEMLFCNIVNNPSTYFPDKKEAYLEFWYQPLLKREKIEVGFACGSKPYAMLRVNLMDYITVADSEYGESAPWQLVKIPVSDFADNNKTAFYRDNSSYNEFDWTRFAGFSIAGSDENLTGQTNFCRIDDVKIAKYITAPTSLEVADKSYDKVTLQWKTPGESVDGYYIYRDGVHIKTTSELSFTDTGLQGNHDYTYFVQAYKGKAESEAAVVTARTDGYFVQKPGTGVFFENIRYTVGGSELSDYVIRAGALNFDASIGVEQISSPVYAVAAVYSENTMKECKIQEITPDKAGSTVSFKGQFTVSNTSEYVDIFIVKSLSRLQPMTGCYRITGAAYQILDGVKASASIKHMTASYSPRTHLIGLNTETSAEGTIVCAVVPAGADLTKLNPSDFVWIGGMAVNSGKDTAEIAFPKDKNFPEGEYIAISGTFSNSFQSEPFYYASDETIEKLSKVLNDKNSSDQQILETLTNRALVLDLTDFNTLSQSEKMKVCALFREYYDGDMALIENVFAKAQGAVILGTATKNGCDMILKYGGYLDIGEQFINGIKSGYSTKIKDSINALAADAAVKYDTSSDLQENAASRVETVCILALLGDSDLTWSGMRTYLTETFADYNIADTDAIDEAGVTESSVYKKMIGRKYKSFKEVDDALKKAIAEVEDDENGSGPTGPRPGGSSGGSGGGSGISRGDGIVAQPPVTPEQDHPQQETAVYFKDAAGMSWAYDKICNMAEKGVISYAEEFRPNDNTTRAEFVKMIVLAFGLLDTQAQCSFTDVPADAWEYSYVASAVQAGIVNGVGDSRFEPNQPVTRQDMACMVYRILNTATENGKSFADQDQISSYAMEAVLAMSGLGVINGYEDGSFKPGQFATRAETAVMLNRAMKIETA